MLRLNAIVTGTVQGVYYRSYVTDAATALQLVGYAKNEVDGSVTVVAEGSNDTLRNFVEYLHEGSLQSKVEGVAVEWGTATGEFDEFGIRASI
jgi:acylphosphatase